MAEDSLFRRILRGAARPSDRKRQEEDVLPSEKREPGLPEKILDTPISRRQVLGGAATTAGHIAQAATIPQSPLVIQQGIKEAAAILAPTVDKGGWDFIRQITRLNNTFEYKESKTGITGEYEGTGEFSPTIENTFIKGAPLTSEGRWAHQQFFEMSWLGNLPLPSSLTLKDLKDPTILREAYRLAGIEYPKDSEFLENLKGAIGVLQRVTGISNDNTCGQLQEAYRSKVREVAAHVLNNPDVFPPKLTADMPWEVASKRQTALRYLEDTLTYTGKKERYPELAERIAAERQHDEAYYEERRRAMEMEEARTNEYWKTEGKRIQEGRMLERQAAEDKAAKQEREEFNEKMERRETIACSVQRDVSNPQDLRDAQAFLIHPEEFESIGHFKGLTRMHIQHLRQILTHGETGKDKTARLDNFNPANTRVEMVGQMIRVSTADEKFQKYLGEFADNPNKWLQIPNRLQMVVPDEEK